MRGGLTRFVPAPARRALRTYVEPPFEGRVVTRTPDGIVLWGDLKHARYFLGLALQVWQVEPLMRRLFARHVGDGRDVVDVGAYLGIYALTAARASGVGQVWAFEPDPQSYRLLTRNLRANRAEVDARPAAVSDVGGEVAFTVIRQLGGGSHVGGEDTASIRVPAVTLDEQLGAGERAVGVIKLDVEGHEIEALRGACEVIARSRPVLFVEHDHANLARHGHTSADLLGLLEELGYDVRVIDERDRRIVEPSVASLGQGHVNLYARPR